MSSHVATFTGGPLDGQQLVMPGSGSIYRGDDGNWISTRQGDREFLTGRRRRYYSRGSQRFHPDGTLEQVYVHATVNRSSSQET
jgi:hypothetical protein